MASSNPAFQPHASTANSCQSTAGFYLPQTDLKSPLNRILSAALPQLASSKIQYETIWNAEYFNLNQVQIFQDATFEEQQKICAIANRSLLEESYFIEQAGVGYMAKMVLMADTQDERLLYGLFAADEASHFAQIRQFLPDFPAATDDPFLTLLSELVNSPDKTMMLFILQVVLEGWGLTHYRQLAAACQHPQLRQCLHNFIDAEARHHGTGLTLFNQRDLTSESQHMIFDILSQFLHMIQIGPQRILSAIAQVKGHLSRQQAIQILTELDTLAHSGKRLKILRHLIETPQTYDLIQALEQHHCFQPLPAHLCV
jgi:hypothetical protein